MLLLIAFTVVAGTLFIQGLSLPWLARRLKVPLDKFPKIVAVDAACLKLPAFDKARPEKQPDPSDASAQAC